MRRDPFPLEQPLDYVRPEERVPRPPRTTPPLRLELAIAISLALAIGTLYVLPALQAWLSTWGLAP